jgi:hydrogenase/urease accessory protein HupE
MMTMTPIDLHRRTCARIAASLMATLPAVAAQAHPGHDATPTLGFFEGLVHLLTQPDHLAMLAIAVVLGRAATRAWRARRTSGRDSTPRRR